MLEFIAVSHGKRRLASWMQAHFCGHTSSTGRTAAWMVDQMVRLACSLGMKQPDGMNHLLYFSCIVGHRKL